MDITQVGTFATGIAVAGAAATASTAAAIAISATVFDYCIIIT